MRSRIHRTWVVWGLTHEKPHTQDMGSVGVNIEKPHTQDMGSVGANTREAAYTGQACHTSYDGHVNI